MREPLHIFHQCAPMFPSWTNPIDYRMFAARSEIRSHIIIGDFNISFSGRRLPQSFALLPSPLLTAPFAVRILQPSCFIAAAHCFRTAPSSSGILCFFPYRKCLRMTGHLNAAGIVSGSRTASIYTEHTVREPSPMNGTVSIVSIGPHASFLNLNLRLDPLRRDIPQLALCATQSGNAA